MSDAEHKLAELFAADVPAADRAFAFAVLERIERRRMWVSILETVPFALAAGALLWLLAPTISALLNETVESFDAPTFVASVAVLLSVLAFLTMGRDGAPERSL